MSGLTIETCDRWIARYAASGNCDMVNRWLDARRHVADNNAITAAFAEQQGRSPERGDEVNHEGTWLRFVVIGDLAELWMDRDASDRILAENSSRKMWRTFL